MTRPVPVCGRCNIPYDYARLWIPKYGHKPGAQYDDPIVQRELEDSRHFFECSKCKGVRECSQADSLYWVGRGMTGRCSPGWMPPDRQLTLSEASE